MEADSESPDEPINHEQIKIIQKGGKIQPFLKGIIGVAYEKI